MPLITREDCSIFYEILGQNGPWLTLINGHTRSSRDFRLLAGNLAKQGLRCLLIDNRGSGETICNQAFTLRDIALDVGFIWQHLAIKQSVLMGLSLGGMICQILQPLYPERVSGLILVATGCSEHCLSAEALAPWGQSEDSVERKLRAYFAEGFLGRNKVLVQAMVKQILQGIQSDHFESRAQSQRDAMQGVDTRPFLKGIQCPTLIIHGTEDRIIAHSSGVELHHLIQGSRLQSLPGVGHLVLAEYSRGLAQETLKFFLENHWLESA